MKCTLTRWALSSALDSGTPLKPGTLLHLSTCADCARHQERLYVLDARLRTEAEHAHRPRIVAAPVRWPLFAAAAVFAVVLLIALRPPTNNRQPISDDRQPITDNRQPATDDRQSTPDVRRPITDPVALVRAAEKLSVGRLDTEWRNLVADSRSGLDHVLRISGVNDLL